MEKKKERIQVSVDSETLQKLRELVEANHTSISQWVTDRVWEKANAAKAEDITGYFGK